MELDETFGVELVPAPQPPAPYQQAIQGVKRRDPNFTDEGFLASAIQLVGAVRTRESGALFGWPPGLEPDPEPSNLTDDFKRRRAEVLQAARAAGTESVRLLSMLSFAFVNVTGDRNWDAIVVWVNFIAELKVPGRDGPPDEATIEQPQWNATLGDYCTFIRPVAVTTPRDQFAPFNWLLHDLTPDPSATRRLPDGFRPRSVAA